MEENKDLGMTLSGLVSRLHLEEEVSLTVPQTEQFESFVRYIEDLISNNFDKLVNILYRIDVSEQKIKEALSVNNGVGAGRLLATLILEREAEKVVWRKKYSQK